MAAVSNGLDLGRHRNCYGNEADGIGTEWLVHGGNLNGLRTGPALRSLESKYFRWRIVELGCLLASIRTIPLPRSFEAIVPLLSSPVTT